MDCPVSPAPMLNILLALVREVGPVAFVTIVTVFLAGLILPIVLCIIKCGDYLTSISGLAGWVEEFQAELKSDQKYLIAKIENLSLKIDINLNTLKAEMALREIRADQLLWVQTESIKNSLAAVQSSIAALDNRVGRLETLLDHN